MKGAGGQAVKLLIFFSFFATTLAHAILFGPDDRLERFEIKDPATLEFSKSTAGLVEADKLKVVTVGNEKGFAIDFNLPGSGRQPAPGPGCTMAFGGEPQLLSYCSSTLIGPDLLLTEGHCFSRGPDSKPEDICAKTYAIFDYAIGVKGEDPVTFPARNVFQCKKLEVNFNEDNYDFAVIRLDRKVTGRKIMTVRTADDPRAPLADDQKLTSSGYPKGYPNKTVMSGRFITTIHNDASAPYADPRIAAVIYLHTQGGSSGSAVVDPGTGEIVGIVSGTACPTIDWDPVHQCFFEVQFNGQCDGVTMVRTDGVFGSKLVPLPR